MYVSWWVREMETCVHVSQQTCRRTQTPSCTYSLLVIKHVSLWTSFCLFSHTLKVLDSIKTEGTSIYRQGSVHSLESPPPITPPQFLHEVWVKGLHPDWFTTVELFMATLGIWPLCAQLYDWSQVRSEWLTSSFESAGGCFFPAPCFISLLCKTTWASLPFQPASSTLSSLAEIWTFTGGVLAQALLPRYLWILINPS